MTKKHQQTRKKTNVAYKYAHNYTRKTNGCDTVIQSIINVDTVECAVAKFISSLIVSTWLSATFRFVDPREIF
jgi:hypothetical protein